MTPSMCRYPAAAIRQTSTEQSSSFLCLQMEPDCEKLRETKRAISVWHADICSSHSCRAAPTCRNRCAACALRYTALPFVAPPRNQAIVQLGTVEHAPYQSIPIGNPRTPTRCSRPQACSYGLVFHSVCTAPKVPQRHKLQMTQTPSDTPPEYWQIYCGQKREGYKK